MRLAHVVLLSSSLTLFSATAVAGECSAPQMPNVPEGDTATQSQMDQAKAEVKDFAQESQDYLSCLKDKTADATADERDRIAGLYNNMVNEVEEATADMQAAAHDFQQRVASNMREADAATQDEQDAIAAMYQTMVSELKAASSEAKEAWQDYQQETEEAE